jgi:hypothetical protein
MKKRMLMACLVAGIALAGITGCSEDGGGTIVEGSQYLTFKNGDSFTYKVYNRDSTNANITNPDSVTTETWTVIDTNASAYSRTGVTVFLVTSNGMQDTVYMQSQANGNLWQYNVLGKMVARIEIASAFADQVPASWVNISHTKAVTAEPLTPTNASFPMTIATITANTFLTLTPSHKGQLSSAVTAGDSSYTKVFHTDHSLAVRAETTQLGTVLNDSLSLHYDVGLQQGMIRQSLDSKQVELANIGPLQVSGFERVLVSYSRK